MMFKHILVDVEDKNGKCYQHECNGGKRMF
jgi:hypothetical protein